VVHKEFFQVRSSPNTTALDTASVANWKEYASRGHRLGAGSAPVTLVVFSDFQCPYCRRFATYLPALRTRFGDNLAIIFRHFPLQYHVLAKVAANAAECAGEQNRFWEYHDLLFEKQDSLGVVPWTDLAKRSGVQDTIAFKTCQTSTRSARVIGVDSSDAVKLRLHGTPGILINRILLDGLLPLELLDSLVQGQLRQARSTGQ
jgi:protein-disulfide isomerase